MANVEVIPVYVSFSAGCHWHLLEFSPNGLVVHVHYAHDQRDDRYLAYVYNQVRHLRPNVQFRIVNLPSEPTIIPANESWSSYMDRVPLYERGRESPPQDVRVLDRRLMDLATEIVNHASSHGGHPRFEDYRKPKTRIAIFNYIRSFTQTQLSDRELDEMMPHILKNLRA